MKRTARILAIILTAITITRSLSLIPMMNYFGKSHEFWAFEPVMVTCYCMMAALACWGFYFIKNRQTAKA